MSCPIVAPRFDVDKRGDGDAAPAGGVPLSGRSIDDGSSTKTGRRVGESTTNVGTRGSCCEVAAPGGSGTGGAYDGAGAGDAVDGAGTGGATDGEGASEEADGACIMDVGRGGGGSWPQSDRSGDGVDGYNVGSRPSDITGWNRRRNCLLRVVKRPEPATLTTYWSFAPTSTTSPVLSHRFGELLVWF